MYSYDKFIIECKQVSKKSRKIDNFIWNIIEHTKSFIVNIFFYFYGNLKSLKSNITVNSESNNSIIFEFEILFSEVYNVPTLYFMAYDLEQSKYIEFEDLIEKDLLDSTFISNKLLEYSKQVKYIYKITESSLYRLNL